MLILAFDTTVAACSVALWRDGATLAHARDVMEQGQAEALMPMVEDVMGRSGLGYDALDRIAVTVGPGSFTGVRVGLAAARGLGLAAGKPVIGVMTTEALAHAVPAAERRSDTHILCAVDTKRGDIYAHIFDHHLTERGAPHVLTPAQVKDALDGHAVVVGDAAAIAVAALGPRAVLSSAAALPDPAVIAAVAATRQPTATGPLPVYVRPPDAVIPQHGGRLRS